MATTTWTDDEMLKLIDFWGDEAVQAILEGCSRSKHVYERLACGNWKMQDRREPEFNAEIS